MQAFSTFDHLFPHRSRTQRERCRQIWEETGMFSLMGNNLPLSASPCLSLNAHRTFLPAIQLSQRVIVEEGPVQSRKHGEHKMKLA